MRFAVCNLALPAFDHLDWLPRLVEHGVSGLEVAPYRTFAELPGTVPTRVASRYRSKVDAAGLSVIGLRAVTRGPLNVEELAIGPHRRQHLAELTMLSALCRDLGGRTLSLEARHRGTFLANSAQLVLSEFLETLLPKIEPHGTRLCIAPLAPGDGDVCVTANDCNDLILAMDHPALALDFGTAALGAHGRVRHTTFALAQGQMELFHVDEPGRDLVGHPSSAIDHADFRLHLLGCEYAGWVSMVQKMPADSDGVDALERGLSFVASTYFPRAEPLRLDFRRRR